MEVELPNEGCNIITGNSSFYNYYNNNRNRDTYYIYEGVAHKSATATSVQGYTYTGDCISTGDLVFKPELRVYYPIFAFIVIMIITLIIYKVVLERFLK